MSKLRRVSGLNSRPKQFLLDSVFYYLCIDIENMVIDIKTAC